MEEDSNAPRQVSTLQHYTLRGKLRQLHKGTDLLMVSGPPHYLFSEDSSTHVANSEEADQDHEWNNYLNKHW